VPTVFRLHGFRVVIRFNDHRPAHVHVQGAGNEALFDLHCPDGPVELRTNYGFKVADLNRIADGLEEARTQLCEEWRAIHGNDY
jgi:hypothetical protein